MADPQLRLLLSLLLSVACGSAVKLFFRASVYVLSLLSQLGDSGAECLVIPMQHTRRGKVQAGLPQCEPLGAWVEAQLGGEVKGVQRPLCCPGLGATVWFCPSRVAWQNLLAVAE